VGLFRRKDQRSEAERTLEAMSTPSAALEREDEPEDEQDLFLELLERPASTEPGTPLRVVNSGTLVRVGDAVTLITAYATQPTTVRRLLVDGAEVTEAAESVGFETERLEVVLGDVDLTDVYRSSWIGNPDDRHDDRTYETFAIQVLRAEPRGKDALVVGRLLHGIPAAGRLVSCTEDLEEARVPTAKVKDVEPAGEGEVALVLKGQPAERFLVGDRVAGMVR
jgi:hypothetical protein